MRLTPTTAFAIQATLPRSNLATGACTAVNGNFPIGRWAVLAVLAACTAVALGAAGAATHARWRPRPLRHTMSPKRGTRLTGARRERWREVGGDQKAV
jgi:hypothetical protein